MTESDNRQAGQVTARGRRALLKVALGAGVAVAVATTVTVAVAGESAGPSTVAAAAAANHGFLKRSGKQLMLDGQPYKFVGVNAFGLTGCDGQFTDTSDAGLDAYFKSLRPKSITRTWAFEPQGIEAVDRVVAAAERNNQMLILALADGANFCGDDGHDAAFYAGGYKDKYLPWVKKVVARYPKSVAIGMWEIMNEPRGASSDTVMKKFFDETAAVIKGLSPNHLVSTGTLAQYSDGTNDFAYVHSGPNIDVGSLHEYDYHTSNGLIISNHFWITHAAMDSINKPMYLGEVGVTAADSGCLSRSARVGVVKQKWDGYLNEGAVGVMSWNYRTTKNNSCTFTDPGTIYPADPLMAAMKSYDIPGITDPTNGTPKPTTTKPTTPTTQIITKYDENTFKFTGTWEAGEGAGKYKNDDRYSSTTGSTYTVTFTGTRIRIYTSVAPHHGIAAVKLDNGAEELVDFYSAERAEMRKVYVSKVLPKGKHTLTIRVTGTKSSASTGVVITADRADITS